MWEWVNKRPEDTRSNIVHIHKIGKSGVSSEFIMGNSQGALLLSPDLDLRITATEPIIAKVLLCLDPIFLIGITR